MYLPGSPRRRGHERRCGHERMATLANRGRSIAGQHERRPCCGPHFYAFRRATHVRVRTVNFICEKPVSLESARRFWVVCVCVRLCRLLLVICGSWCGCYLKAAPKTRTPNEHPELPSKRPNQRTHVAPVDFSTRPVFQWVSLTQKARRSTELVTATMMTPSGTVRSYQQALPGP